MQAATIKLFFRTARDTACCRWGYELLGAVFLRSMCSFVAKEIRVHSSDSWAVSIRRRQGYGETGWLESRLEACGT